MPGGRTREKLSALLGVLGELGPALREAVALQYVLLGGAFNMDLVCNQAQYFVKRAPKACVQKRWVTMVAFAFQECATHDVIMLI